MADKGKSIWNKVTFCLITGGSKGLGRAVALAFAPKLVPGSCVMLVARDLTLLHQVKSDVNKAAPGVEVKVVACDLTEADEDFYIRLIADVDHSKFEAAVVVHNVGSLGRRLDPLVQYRDRKELQEYFSLNVSSVLSLNSVFISAFSKRSVYVINISSLLALQPCKSIGLYCTAKAARDMAFRVLALEEPSVRVLNYAPGPLDTDMHEFIRTKCSDDDVRAAFVTKKKKGEVLDAAVSAKRLVTILHENRFTSGDHVDYFDKV